MELCNTTDPFFSHINMNLFVCFLIEYGLLKSIYFMFPFGTDRPRSLAMQHMLIVLSHSVSENCNFSLFEFGLFKIIDQLYFFEY